MGMARKMVQGQVALGFYKTPAGWTSILLLVGKGLRFLAWTLLVGLL